MELWVIALIAGYGLFQLVRRAKGESPTTGSSDSSHSGPTNSSVPSIGSARPNTNRERHVPPSHRRLTKQSRRNPKRKSCWVEPGGTATVAGRTIGGMIYLGPEPNREMAPGIGGAFIDPELPVATAGSDFSGESMPYWPRYSSINPRARATYLDWLAGERSDKQYGPGYVFLYFYGLEQRFFVDSPSEHEKHFIVGEVERLLDIYGENHSIQHYLRAFLDAARIVLGSVGDTEPRFKKSGYELPLGLLVAIGRMAKEKQPLSSDWLLS